MLQLGRIMFIGGFGLMVAAFFFPVSLDGSAGSLDGLRLANSDLLAQRSMLNLTGAATMIAGAVLMAIAEIKRRIGAGD